MERACGKGRWKGRRLRIRSPPLRTLRCGVDVCGEGWDWGILRISVVTGAAWALTGVMGVRVRPGYIGEFELIDDHRGGKIVVELNGRLNKCGVIRYASGAAHLSSPSPSPHTPVAILAARCAACAWFRHVSSAPPALPVSSAAQFQPNVVPHSPSIGSTPEPCNPRPSAVCGWTRHHGATIVIRADTQANPGTARAQALLRAMAETLIALGVCVWMCTQPPLQRGAVRAGGLGRPSAAVAFGAFPRPPTGRSRPISPQCRLWLRTGPAVLPSHSCMYPSGRGSAHRGPPYLGPLLESSPRMPAYKSARLCCVDHSSARS